MSHKLRLPVRATSLTEDIIDCHSTRWDRLRELVLGVPNGPQEERQEKVIRMLATEISKYISVRDWLPHFQKRQMLFSEEEEEELLLEQTPIKQGAKLSAYLSKLSKRSRHLLPALLLSVMDSYEEFTGGKSTHDHWTFVELLLNTVNSVDGLSPYQLPSVPEVLSKLCGVDFNVGTSIAFADALGVGHDSFKSYKGVVEKWLRTNKNCSFTDLVQALLCTRELGRLVTGLCSACRSNPPYVFSWFKKLSIEDLQRVASFVGFSSEIEIIQTKYCNDKKRVHQIFLRCLWIPDCGENTLKDILCALAKATGVKVSQTRSIRARTPVTSDGKQRTEDLVQVLDSFGFGLKLITMDRPSAHSPLPNPEDDAYSQQLSGSQLQFPLIASPESHNMTEAASSNSPCKTTDPDLSEDQHLVQGEDVILQACISKEWGTALALLQSQSTKDTFVEQYDQGTGKTALHFAFENGKLELAEQLMKVGADATKLTMTGLSVLNYPRVFRNEDVLRRVLEAFTEKGCSVDTAGNANRYLTPLMLVCYDGDALFASAQFLLDSGASPEGNKKAYSSPMIVASEGGHRRLVELLLAKGTPLNTQDRSMSTALLQACRHRHLEVAAILLEQPDINVNLSDKSGSTPLFEIVSANNVPLAKRLLGLGARVNITREISNEIMTGSIEETPLADACARGFEELVEVLVDNNADLNYKCAGTVPPIGFAILGHQTHIIERLLKYNALSSSIDDLSAPIISAVRVKNYECVKKLVDRLGGIESAFQQASEKGLDLLATHIKMFETVADSSLATGQDSFLKQQRAELNARKEQGILNEATLDRFCHLCVLAVREYETTGNHTLQELSSIAKGLHPKSPNIPEFLSSVANYQSVNSDLQRLLLHGTPSALTFLINENILTNAGFVAQALKYFNDNPEEFYQKLVGALQSIPRGENLPNDIEGALNHVFTQRFGINITVLRHCAGDGGFPSNDDLPEDFRVKDHSSMCVPLNLDTVSIPLASTLDDELLAAYQCIGEGEFPPNDKLPQEFRVESSALLPDPTSGTAEVTHNDLSMDKQSSSSVTKSQPDVECNPIASQIVPTCDPMENGQMQLPNTDNESNPSVDGLPADGASPTHPATQTRRQSLQRQEQCPSLDSKSSTDMEPEKPEIEGESQNSRVPADESTNNMPNEGLHWELSSVSDTTEQGTLNSTSTPKVGKGKQKSLSPASTTRNETADQTKSGKRLVKPPTVRQTATSKVRKSLAHSTHPSQATSKGRERVSHLSSNHQFRRNQSDPNSGPHVCRQSRQYRKAISLNEAERCNVFDATIRIEAAPTISLVTAIRFFKSHHSHRYYSVKVMICDEIVWEDNDTYYKANKDEESIRNDLSSIFSAIGQQYDSTLLDVVVTGFVF